VERKDLLHLEQKVTDLSAVDEAAAWADRLIGREFRGPGDTIDAARYRTARKHGVPESSLWALRYRRPKDIAGSVYRALQRAYEAECERQEARLRHELEITKTLQATQARSSLVAETEAVLGPAEGEAIGTAAERAVPDAESF